MEWTQVISIIGANLAMFLLSVRQSNTFYMHLDKKMEDNRKETNGIIKAIQQEIKDFHDRLCAIEEKNKIK
jgi:hypothetical protein